MLATRPFQSMTACAVNRTAGAIDVTICADINLPCLHFHAREVDKGYGARKKALSRLNPPEPMCGETSSFEIRDQFERDRESTQPGTPGKLTADDQKDKASPEALSRFKKTPGYPEFPQSSFHDTVRRAS